MPAARWRYQRQTPSSRSSSLPAWRRSTSWRSSQKSSAAAPPSSPKRSCSTCRKASRTCPTWAPCTTTTRSTARPCWWRTSTSCSRYRAWASPAPTFRRPRRYRLRQTFPWCWWTAPSTRWATPSASWGRCSTAASARRSSPPTWTRSTRRSRAWWRPYPWRTASPSTTPKGRKACRPSRRARSTCWLSWRPARWTWPPARRPTAAA